MSTEFNKFKIRVGDFYNDGHGRHESFLVLTTAKDFREVYKTYREINKNHNIKISETASSYKDNNVPDDMLLLLDKLDFPFEDYGIDELYFEKKEVDGNTILTNGCIFEPFIFAEIVVFLLNEFSENTYKLDSNFMGALDVGGYGLF